MNRRRPHGALTVLAVLAGLAVLSACGVSSQTTPTKLDPSSVPFRLLASASPTPSTVPLPRHPPADPDVFLVEGNALVGVQRSIPPGSPHARAEAVLAALAAGPVAAEHGSGLGSAIPPDIDLTVVRIDDDVVTIELSGDAGSSAPQEHTRAVAQIVLSATSVPGLRAVLLTRNGEPIEAPLIDGSLTSAPLTPDDFRPLVAARVTRQTQPTPEGGTR